MTKYVFLGDRGELVGSAVFTAYGQTADLDQETAEKHVLNDFPLLPADLFAVTQADPNPCHAAMIALADFRQSILLKRQATPAEVVEK